MGVEISKWKMLQTLCYEIALKCFFFAARGNFDVFVASNVYWEHMSHENMLKCIIEDAC